MTITSTKPDNALLAVQSAASYGALATSLKSEGITYDGLAGSSAPSPAAPGAPGTAASPPAPAGDSGSSGSSSNVGVIVGAVVGGVAAAALAGLALFLVSGWGRGEGKVREAALVGLGPPVSSCLPALQRSDDEFEERVFVEPAGWFLLAPSSRRAALASILKACSQLTACSCPAPPPSALCV